MDLLFKDLIEAFSAYLLQGFWPLESSFPVVAYAAKAGDALPRFGAGFFHRRFDGLLVPKGHESSGFTVNEGGKPIILGACPCSTEAAQ